MMKRIIIRRRFRLACRGNRYGTRVWYSYGTDTNTSTVRTASG